MVWIPGFGKYSPRMGNRVGDKAPDFTLQDQDGRSVHLAEELGHRPVVLVFYPMAGSPVCTRQMCSLRDGWPELMSNAKVFGISYDSVRRFLRRLGQSRPLPFRRMETAPGEEAQVDDPGRVSVESAERLDGGAQVEDVRGHRRSVDLHLEQRDALTRTPALERRSAARLFGEHVAHGATEEEEEVPPVLRLKAALAQQARARGVDEFRRLERAGRGASHEAVGDLAQFRVDDVKELLRRRPVSASHATEQVGDRPRQVWFQLGLHGSVLPERGMKESYHSGAHRFT